MEYKLEIRYIKNSGHICIDDLYIRTFAQLLNLLIDNIITYISRLTTATFGMAYRDENNLHLDTDCQVNPVTQGIPQSEDYLLIPEAVTADGLRGTKFCGISAAGQIVACECFIIHSLNIYVMSHVNYPFLKISTRKTQIYIILIVKSKLFRNIISVL